MIKIGVTGQAGLIGDWRLVYKNLKFSLFDNKKQKCFIVTNNNVYL
jgi:hypothetical protein